MDPLCSLVERGSCSSPWQIRTGLPQCFWNPGAAFVTEECRNISGAFEGPLNFFCEKVGIMQTCHFMLMIIFEVTTSRQSSSELVASLFRFIVLCFCPLWKNKPSFQRLGFHLVQDSGPGIHHQHQKQELEVISSVCKR